MDRRLSLQAFYSNTVSLSKKFMHNFVSVLSMNLVATSISSQLTVNIHADIVNLESSF
jgi:uncharacterized protein (DUF1919 family)